MTVGVSSPTPPSRVRRRSLRSERAILEATIALLGEQGFSGLTVDGIAARAGVGKATIYRHWTGKADVVVDAVRAQAPPIPIPDTGDVRSDLLAVLRLLMDVLTRPPLARVVPALIEAAEHDPELERLFRQFTSERRAVLLNVLRRASARGELRSGLDVDLAADLFVAPLFARRLLLRRPLTRRYAEEVVGVILPALR